MSSCTLARPALSHQYLTLFTAAQVEASLASQLWRGVRFCLSLLVGLTVLTVVFEDKGLGRGMLNSPDMRPESVSNVRFGDVKGVDEAKVGLLRIPCLPGDSLWSTCSAS